LNHYQVHVPVMKFNSIRGAALQADLSEEQLTGFGGYGWPIQSEIERGVRDGDPVAMVRCTPTSFFILDYSFLRSWQSRRIDDGKVSDFSA
jgi:hypothetical protein